MGIFAFLFYVTFFIYLFLCIELNFRIAKIWWLLLNGGVVKVPRASNVVVPATSGERERRVKWWMIEVWWRKKSYTLCTNPGWRGEGNSWGSCHYCIDHLLHHHKNHNTYSHESWEQVLFCVVAVVVVLWEASFLESY